MTKIQLKVNKKQKFSTRTFDKLPQTMIMGEAGAPVSLSKTVFYMTAARNRGTHTIVLKDLNTSAESGFFVTGDMKIVDGKKVLTNIKRLTAAETAKGATLNFAQMRKVYFIGAATPGLSDKISLNATSQCYGTTMRGNVAFNITTKK